MVPARRTSPWVAAGVSLFITCGDDVHPVEFVAHVDRIDAPAWVAADESFEVTVEGNVGPDGCHRLQRVETVRHADRIEITVYGERLVPSRSVVCSDEVSVFEQRIFLDPPFGDDAFTIIVYQPDGPPLRQLVHVRE